MGRKRKAQVNCPSNASESSNSSGSLNGLQRTAANDRERTRMRVLSKAFVRLKTSLPWVPTDTKLSKLDTLKLASAYISYLTKILDDDDNDNLNGDGKEMDFNPSSFIPPSLSSNRLVSTFKPPSLDRNKNIIEHLCNNNSINTNNRNGFSWPYASNTVSNHNHNHAMSQVNYQKMAYINNENSNMYAKRFKYSEGIS